ncbi:hypothetical protein OF83DRAFT_1085134 [Amylostereum chailletii]|nr:hypothetical protein OF83DRAFT_1085134 [Amylostereum chailletii]
MLLRLSPELVQEIALYSAANNDLIALSLTNKCILESLKLAIIYKQRVVNAGWEVECVSDPSIDLKSHWRSVNICFVQFENRLDSLEKRLSAPLHRPDPMEERTLITRGTSKLWGYRDLHIAHSVETFTDLVTLGSELQSLNIYKSNMGFSAMYSFFSLGFSMLGPQSVANLFGVTCRDAWRAIILYGAYLSVTRNIVTPSSSSPSTSMNVNEARDLGHYMFFIATALVRGAVTYQTFNLESMEDVAKDGQTRAKAFFSQEFQSRSRPLVRQAFPLGEPPQDLSQLLLARRFSLCFVGQIFLLFKLRLRRANAALPLPDLTGLDTCVDAMQWAFDAFTGWGHAIQRTPLWDLIKAPGSFAQWRGCTQMLCRNDIYMDTFKVTVISANATSAVFVLQGFASWTGYVNIVQGTVSMVLQRSYARFEFRGIVSPWGIVGLRDDISEVEGGRCGPEGWMWFWPEGCDL